MYFGTVRPTQEFLIGFVQITQLARLLELMWCSFAGLNVLTVVTGRARGFTLRSYGDGVSAGAPEPIPSIGAPFPA